MSVLGILDLLWIAWVVGGMAFLRWLLSDSDARTQRIEAKLDRVLKHIGLDDDELQPP